MHQNQIHTGLETQGVNANCPTRHYKVRIDEKEFKVDTRHPSVELLISLVGRKLCAYELIELRHEGENREVEPGDSIDLDLHGQHGFITAHREIVTIFIKKNPFPVKRGNHTANQILHLVGLTSEGYNLYEEKPGHPPMPVPENANLCIVGCEIFSYQVKSGTSS